MNKNLKKISAFNCLLILFLGFSLPTHADTDYDSINSSVTLSGFYKVMFLTDLNAAIEAEGVLGGGNYTLKMTRKVQFDVLKIRHWFLHFSFKEESLFGPSAGQFDHEIEYLGIGYKAANGNIRLFWDHTCHNPGRKLAEDKRNDIHWNELGIRYETPGMRLGHKSDGIWFDSVSNWLNKINWGISFSRIWMRTENDYEWMFKFAMRDDVLRIANHILYFQLSLDSIYDARGINLNPSLEFGDRIHLYKGSCLIPFVSYKYFYDWYHLGEGEDFFFFGLSLETGPGPKGPKNDSILRAKRISMIPGFHIAGGYANLLNDVHYGHSSDVAIDLDLLEFGLNKLIRLNTYAGILTLPHDLNPYIIRYNIGPSIEIDSDNIDMTIFHSYSSLYGVEYQSAIRNYNLVGLGFKNNHSHWKWNMNIGIYPSTKNFDYWSDLKGDLIYDFFNKEITPYLNCSGHYLLGRGSLFGHAVEAGIKISGETGRFIAYVRHQDNFDVFRFDKETQAFIGIGFDFDLI